MLPKIDPKYSTIRYEIRKLVCMNPYRPDPPESLHGRLRPDLWGEARVALCSTAVEVGSNTHPLSWLLTVPRLP